MPYCECKGVVARPHRNCIVEDFGARLELGKVGLGTRPLWNARINISDGLQRARREIIESYMHTLPYHHCLVTVRAWKYASIRLIGWQRHQSSPGGIHDIGSVRVNVVRVGGIGWRGIPLYKQAQRVDPRLRDEADTALVHVQADTVAVA